MTFRYTPLTRWLKKLYRVFSPVPTSPYTIGEVDDICEINLVPPQKLITFFECCLERLKELNGTVGDYLEFGVFNGSSMASMYWARKNSGLRFNLIGFDAFEGLPPESENEDDGVWKKGFYACSYKDMTSCLERQGIEAKEITWVRGWYNKTLTKSLPKKIGLENIGIVLIDCDTYSSSKTVLDFLCPLIKQPVILCFDDWKLNDLDIKGMGEYKAFNEFLEENPNIHAKEIPSYNRKSKSFLVWCD